MRLHFPAATMCAVVFTACSSTGSVPPSPSLPSESSQSQSAALPSSATAAAAQGAVLYTLSNQTGSNRVLRFVRANGSLVPSGSFDTEGRGDPSIAATVQGALAFSADRHFLFAVDAGSNEVSSFTVAADGLRFNGKIGSGGVQPVSLTVHGDLLYVLNGGSSSIHGFRIGASGLLTSIEGSTRSLSESGLAGAAEIAFNPDGNVVVVTEKMTNRIDIFRLSGDLAQGPSVHPSSGKEPFGFAFVPLSNTVVVSEAFGGAADAAAASSYTVGADALTTLTASLGDHATAACWIAIAPDGSRAFVSNTASSTISSYAIDPHGTLRLTHAVAGKTAQGPADLAWVPQSDLLSVLDAKGDAIEVFRADASGALTALAAAHGLPAGAVGLLASPN